MLQPSLCCLLLCASLISSCRTEPARDRGRRPARMLAPAKHESAAPGTGLTTAPESKRRIADSRVKHVIVIALENRDAEDIYADSRHAPYIHSLLAKYAHAENFIDVLPMEIPSEGHYVWMEAGTHRFSDALFDDDSPPSARVSTGSGQHLVRQIEQSNAGITWMSYQEGLNAETGACPIRSFGFYAPKHNPFVFFRDVSGDPPAIDTEQCVAHHRPYSALRADLTGELASYVFITPDQCHDMHGQPGCPEENPIRTGDRWLSEELPALIAYADRSQAVIFITFDEGSSKRELPFIAIGPMVKTGYASRVRHTHGSQLKSVALILGLEPLPTVAGENDLSDLFQPGAFP